MGLCKPNGLKVTICQTLWTIQSSRFQTRANLTRLAEGQNLTRLVTLKSFDQQIPKVHLWKDLNKYFLFMRFRRFDRLNLPKLPHFSVSLIRGGLFLSNVDRTCVICLCKRDNIQMLYIKNVSEG